MKKIKKVFLLIPVAILLISLLFVKKEETKKVLLLGDNSNIKVHLQNQLKDYHVEEFTLSTIKSKELLYYVTSNAHINVDNKKKTLNELIKSSDFIVISIGLNDIISKIVLNKYEKSVSYDVDNMNLAFSLLEQNLFNIIEHIELVNDKTNIILTSYNDPFVFLDKEDENHALIKNLNSLMNSISLLFDANYLEIVFDNENYYENEFSFYLNDEGKRKIAENIYQKIVAINQ